MAVDIFWTWIEANRVYAKSGPKKQMVVTFHPFKSFFLVSFLLFSPLISFFAKNSFLLLFH